MGRGFDPRCRQAARSSSKPMQMKSTMTCTEPIPCFRPITLDIVMLDFICMVFAELLSLGYKRKIQHDNVCLRRESNQRPLAFQRVPLTTRLPGLLTTSE